MSTWQMHRSGERLRVIVRGRGWRIPLPWGRIRSSSLRAAPIFLLFPYYQNRRGLRRGAAARPRTTDPCARRSLAYLVAEHPEGAPVGDLPLGQLPVLLDPRERR